MQIHCGRCGVATRLHALSPDKYSIDYDTRVSETCETILERLKAQGSLHDQDMQCPELQQAAAAAFERLIRLGH